MNPWHFFYFLNLVSFTAFFFRFGGGAITIHASCSHSQSAKAIPATNKPLAPFQSFQKVPEWLRGAETSLCNLTQTPLHKPLLLPRKKWTISYTANTQAKPWLKSSFRSCLWFQKYTCIYKRQFWRFINKMEVIK